MCMLTEKLVNKMMDKMPLARKLEEKTGIRPHGFWQLMGKDVGQGKNRFYQPGGAGYAEDPAPGRPEQTHHINTIASARAKLDAQRKI